MSIYELPFSKWLCDWAGDNRMPYAYSTDLRNIRIINQVTTIRKWYKSVVDDVTWTTIKGLVSNNSNLYVVVDSKLKSCDLTNWNYTNIWSLPNDNDVWTITFGKYTIILTGWVPYVYDWATLSAVTTYVTNSNPSFGTEFLNFTWIAWTWSFSNILYQSRPIISTNQEYSYDWNGSWAWQIIMKSNILWMVATLSRLVIFTEKSIEYIDRGSYTTIGWVLNFYPNPIAQWERLANNRCAVSAWDKIFLLTADKKIKTIDYISWIDDLKIWELSDDEKVWIPNFMNSLNDDLSKSVWFYDQKNKLIKFFVRSKNSLTNDICIIWDLVNKTFLVDNNKFYSILTNHNNKVYAWSCLNSYLYEDEIWTDDDWWEIAWYRYWAILVNGNQNKNKMYNSVSTSGTINSTTKIRKEVILDWDIIDSSLIERQENIIWGTASSSTWSIMTWWNSQISILKNFTKHRWSEYINSIWRYLQIKYSGSGAWQDFTLETIETKEKLSVYEELTDK